MYHRFFLLFLMELCKIEFKRTHTFPRHPAVAVLETANMSIHEIMFSVSINNKNFFINYARGITKFFSFSVI